MAAVASIPANSTILIDPMYTVPSGKRVVVGYMKATKDKNSITYGDLLVNSATFCPAYVFQHLITTLSPIAGFDFTEGTVLGFTCTNYLDEVIDNTLTLMGYIYDI